MVKKNKLVKELLGIFHKRAKDKPPLTEEEIEKATEEGLAEGYRTTKEEDRAVNKDWDITTGDGIEYIDKKMGKDHISTKTYAGLPPIDSDCIILLFFFCVNRF